MLSITSVTIDPNFDARLQQFTVLPIVEIVVAHTRASRVLRTAHATIEACDVSAEVHQRLTPVALILGSAVALETRERSGIALP